MPYGSATPSPYTATAAPMGLLQISPMAQHCRAQGKSSIGAVLRWYLITHWYPPLCDTAATAGQLLELLRAVAPTGSDRHAAAGSERRVGAVALCISAHVIANGRVCTLVEAEVAAMAAK